ncbi:transmembrane gamma-carboxyglutamic acid protein 3 [Vipera latastei]
MEFWKGYAYSVKDASNGTDRSDAMYVMVPLLGVALLIVIGLFIIWRCQLQKVMHHRPSYPQNRGLASRAARSLPRVRVHREAPPSQSEAHYQRDPSSRGAVDALLCSAKGGEESPPLCLLSLWNAAFVCGLSLDTRPPSPKRSSPKPK